MQCNNSCYFHIGLVYNSNDYQNVKSNLGSKISTLLSVQNSCHTHWLDQSTTNCLFFSHLAAWIFAACVTIYSFFFFTEQVINLFLVFNVAICSCLEASSQWVPFVIDWGGGTRPLRSLKFWSALFSPQMCRGGGVDWMVPALITALILNREWQLGQRLDPPVAEPGIGSCHRCVCHLQPSGSSLSSHFPERSQTCELASWDFDRCYEVCVYTISFPLPFAMLIKARHSLCLMCSAQPVALPTDMVGWVFFSSMMYHLSHLYPIHY